MAKYKLWDRSVSGQADYFGWFTLGTNPTKYPYNASYVPTGNYRYETNRKERTWNVTPNWKSLLQSQGYLPTLSMGESLSFMVQLRTVGVFKIADGFQSGEYSGPVITTAPGGISTCPGGLFDAEIAGLLDSAKSDALAKARDMKANVAVMFGEGRQTVRMVLDAANRLGRAYRSFRRGRFSEAAKALGIKKPSRGAANHWLEYSYGWLPLLSDAKGLAELAAQHAGLGGRPLRITVKSRAYRLERNAQVMSNPTYPCDFSQGHLKGYTWRYDFLYEARAGMLLEITNTAAQLAAQTGFGLTDPLLVAWELTPFSFVFDWFVDVGSRLEEISSLQGLDVKTGFVSELRSSKGVAVGGRKDNAGWVLQQDPPGYPFAFRSYNRQSWLGTTTLRTPLWDGLNARRLVTSAALWRQRLRGDRAPGGYHP